MSLKNFYIPKLASDDDFDKRHTRINDVMKGFLHDTSVHGIPTIASAKGM